MKKACEIVNKKKKDGTPVDNSVKSEAIRVLLKNDPDTKKLRLMVHAKKIVNMAMMMLERKRASFKDCAIGRNFKRRTQLLCNLKTNKNHLINVKFASIKETFEVMFADHKSVTTAHKKSVMECYKNQFKTETTQRYEKLSSDLHEISQDLETFEKEHLSEPGKLENMELCDLIKLIDQMNKFYDKLMS